MVSRNRSRRRAQHKAGREQRKKKQTFEVKQSTTQASAWKPATTGKPVSTFVRRNYCEHWQDEFRLLEGLTVYASAHADRPFTEKEKLSSFTPDVGFYLDTYWGSHLALTTAGHLPWMPASRTQTVLFPWPDMGIPYQMRQFDAAAQWLLEQIKMGKTVDIGCFGAHGRTGTLLACLLVLQGMPAPDAIKRVRSTHCVEAIETSDQVKFIYLYDTRINGREHAHMPEAKGSKEWSGYRPMRLNDTVSEWMSGSRSTDSEGNSLASDDEDYELWLRLQADAMTNHPGMSATGAYEFTADEDCEYPPCPHRNECNGKEGECFRAAMWGSESSGEWTDGDDW